MPDIHELSDEIKDGIPDMIRAIRFIVQDPQASPKERMDAVKAFTGLAATIMDRTDPKVTRNQEVRMDLTHLAKDLALHLQPEEAARLLENIETKMLPPPKTAAGRPKHG